MNNRYTVIIPVFNTHKELLQICVRSALQFDEIILIDDGSAAETAAYLDQLAAQNPAVSLYHLENHGVSAARNAGIRYARGNRILFLDSDDYYSDGFREKLDTLYTTKSEHTQKEEEQGPDCISFGFLKHAKQDIPFDPKEYAGLCSPEKLKELSSDADLGFGLCWNKVYRRDILVKHHIFFNEALRYGEDIEFVYRYYNAISSAYILDGCYYHYRMNTGSATQHYNPKLAQEYIRTMQVIARNPGISQNIKNRIILDHLIFTVFKEAFHPDKGNYFYCRKELGKLLETEIYAKALKTGGFRKFGLKKRIILFGLKYRLYFMEYLLTRINYAGK